MSCIVLAWLKIIKNFSLEAAETSSVVVEILKLVLAGNQVRDKLVNVNKMPTNLEGGVVESAFFGVFLQKKNCWTVIFTCIEDCRIISRGITEIKLTRSRFDTSMLICAFPAYLSNYILP